MVLPFASKLCLRRTEESPGGCPVMAGVARELSALTVAVVTKPFGFERGRRMAVAERGTPGSLRVAQARLFAEFTLSRSKTLRCAQGDTGEGLRMTLRVRDTLKTEQRV